MLLWHRLAGPQARSTTGPTEFMITEVEVTDVSMFGKSFSSMEAYSDFAGAGRSITAISGLSYLVPTCQLNRMKKWRRKEKVEKKRKEQPGEEKGSEQNS